MKLKFGKHGPEFENQGKPELAIKFFKHIYEEFAKEYCIEDRVARIHLIKYDNRQDLKDFIIKHQYPCSVYWLLTNVSWGLEFTEEQVVELKLKYLD